MAGIRLRCRVCGARLTPSEYVGRSHDLAVSFYRCRYCGTVIAIREPAAHGQAR